MKAIRLATISAWSILAVFICFFQIQYIRAQSNEERQFSIKLIPIEYSQLDKTSDSNVTTRIYEEGENLIVEFENSSQDTVYFYATTLNENLVYNRNIIKANRTQIMIDLSEKIPHPCTYFSGMKQFQVYQLYPYSRMESKLSIHKINKITKVAGRKVIVKSNYYKNISVYSQNGNDLTGWVNKGNMLTSSLLLQ